MADVEIYIENPDIDTLIGWVENFLENPLTTQQDDDIITVVGNYQKAIIPVIIQLNIEDGPFVGVWFNSEEAPWKSDADCAREAFKFFDTTIQCDPGDEYPDDNQFLEISESGEAIIRI